MKGGSKQMKSKSLSFTLGRGCIDHNNRKTHTDNFKIKLSLNNIYLVQKDIYELYAERMSDAIIEYNKWQKRKDRHLTVRSYIENIGINALKKNTRKLFYEIIVQIGDATDTHIILDSGDAQLATTILKYYVECFEKRNPNFAILNAVIHLDENTPHLHLDFVPFAIYTSRLRVRNSLTRALEQMDFPSKSRNKSGLEDWINSERNYITELAKTHEIQIKEQHSISRDNVKPTSYIAALDTVFRQTTRDYNTLNDHINKNEFNQYVIDDINILYNIYTNCLKLYEKLKTALDYYKKIYFYYHNKMNEYEERIKQLGVQNSKLLKYKTAYEKLEEYYPKEIKAMQSVIRSKESTKLNKQKVLITSSNREMQRS